MAEAVRTTCPYCGTGCGLIITPDGQVAGDPDHPANHGRLCSKGAALADTLGLETRLLYPIVEGRKVGWDDATAEIAGRIHSVTDLHGPDAFAFYLSGQLLTEDYYVANKLAKGFLGTANVDTNSRLCMASTVAGQRRAFGSDTVPGCYEDLELADLVVLVGSNLAWCHPVLFQRLRQARQQHGTRVVVIDPRRTDSCDIADLHLALKPGTDVALFNGLLSYCETAGVLDRDFLAHHTTGFGKSLAAARADDPAVTGLDPADLGRFYDWFARTPRTVTVFSQGVNQSSAGTDKVNAIINVHLATGRIGLPGSGPFSVTGQPNAMGGREVGGLANQLAAHMDFDAASIDRVKRFWDAPAMATHEGLKAVELFRAVDEGRIKALWIMATNPAFSLPESDLVRRALARCPVVIVSDCVADTDTLRFAHIKLPSLAWGEKDGTVTNSDRTISRQRPFLPAPGEARADWRQLAEVARALGHGGAFGWRGPADIFDEHARLTALDNNGRRDLDLSDWIGADYDNLAPRRWGGKRLFANGGFFTEDGRARLVPLRHQPPAEAVSASWPLVLNTGRARDQWHGMTRTGLSARLSGHRPEPWLAMHPTDCPDLADGALVRVESRLGDCVVRLRRDPGQRPGEVFLPMHWNDCFASRAIVGRLLPGHTDALSGQPESKHVPVRVRPFATDWSGVLISAKDLSPASGWWVRYRLAHAQVTELAGQTAERLALVDQLERSLGVAHMEMIDNKRGDWRFAWFDGDRLAAVLFLGSAPPEIARDWLATLTAGPCSRGAVLAGRAPNGTAATGPILCACHSVGRHAVERAIGDGKATNAGEIGTLLKAGTGCGSCLPEINALLAEGALVASGQAC